MKSDVYHLITVKNGKSDTEEIVKVFSDMAAGRLKLDLNLLNYYDEVPIDYGSTIVDVGTDNVELMIHENQALVIKQNNSTLLKSSHFHKGLDVHCYAAYVSVKKRVVVLHNFSYAQIRAARREAVRVKVREASPAVFNYENSALNGQVVDISMNGISIRCDRVPTMDTDQPGQLNLTINDTLLEVPGSFVKFEDQGAGMVDCMFKMNPSRLSDRVISQFIYQRQVEIIQQLKDGLLVE